MNDGRVAQGHLPLDGAMRHVDRCERAPGWLDARNAEAGHKRPAAHAIWRACLSREFEFIIVSRLALLLELCSRNERNDGRQVHRVGYCKLTLGIEVDAPAGSTLRYTYDAADRLLTTKCPDGTIAKLAYTFFDLTSSTDRLSQTTHYKYDNDRVLLTRTDPDSNSATWGYDSARHVISITDANGYTTSFTLDAEGRATAKTFADGPVQAN
jgi:YD repeat-containing protein